MNNFSNQLKKSNYDESAADYAYKNTQYLTSLAVTTSYLQILFNSESLSVADKQLEVTRLQVERTKKLVDAGSAPKGSLFDIEAQLAREELAQVEADVRAKGRCFQHALTERAKLLGQKREVGCDPSRSKHDEQGRKDAANASLVESCHRELTEFQLAQDDRRDQITRDHEEDIDADKPA